MLEDLSVTESIGRSSELVKGHWWRTFGSTALVDTLNFINLAAAFVYTLAVPFAAIRLALYYFDLEMRDAERRGP